MGPSTWTPCMWHIIHKFIYGFVYNTWGKKLVHFSTIKAIGCYWLAQQHNSQPNNTSKYITTLLLLLLLFSFLSHTYILIYVYWKMTLSIGFQYSYAKRENNKIIINKHKWVVYPKDIICINWVFLIYIFIYIYIYIHIHVYNLWGILCLLLKQQIILWNSPHVHPRFLLIHLYMKYIYIYMYIYD